MPGVDDQAVPGYDGDVVFVPLRDVVALHGPEVDVSDGASAGLLHLGAPGVFPFAVAEFLVLGQGNRGGHHLPHRALPGAALRRYLEQDLLAGLVAQRFAQFQGGQRFPVDGQDHIAVADFDAGPGKW